jgi:hypothetical protein
MWQLFEFDELLAEPGQAEQASGTALAPLTGMTTPRKTPGPESTTTPDAEDGSVHPETRQRVKKEAVPGDKSVPGDGSSKAAPTTQRDARGTHDRDGNQEQSRKVAGG